MWIIDWLPVTLIHLLVLAGILGTIAAFLLESVPFVNRYKLPIQLVSLILLSLGVFLQGALAEKNRYEDKMKEMELVVAQAQAKSQKVNTVIVEKIVKEKEYIRIKGEKVIEYIDREVKVFDTVCKLEGPAIEAHNMAANNELSDGAVNE